MTLRTLDQIIDEMRARMQQEMKIYISELKEDMRHIFEKNRKKNEMALGDCRSHSIVLKETEQGNNYTPLPPSPPPPPPSPPLQSPPPLNIGDANQCFSKLELPFFNGNNSGSWIFEAKRYFSFYHLPEDDKLEAVVVALEDDALLWYEWEHQRRPIRDWEELKGLIHRDFGSSNVADPWSPVSQIGTEHQWSLKEITAPLKEETEEKDVTFLGQHKHGFKNDKWAEFSTLGSLKSEQTMDSYKGNNSNSSPSFIKSVRTTKAEEKLSPLGMESTITKLKPQSTTISPTSTSASPLPPPVFNSNSNLQMRGMESSLKQNQKLSLQGALELWESWSSGTHSIVVVNASSYTLNEHKKGIKKLKENDVKLLSKSNPQIVKLCENMDSKGLDKLISDNCIASIKEEILTILKAAFDPGGWVLDSPGRFYIDGKIYSNLLGVRRTCIMLTNLKVNAICKVITSDGKDRAKDIDENWNPKLNDLDVGASNGNSLEAHVFVQLIGTLGIDSDQKDSSNLIQLLSRQLQSAELSPKMTGVTEVLVNSGRNSAAINLKFAFEFTEQFPPISLLKSYLTKVRRYCSPTTQNDTRERKLTSQEAVYKCIGDHKLEDQEKEFEMKAVQSQHVLENRQAAVSAKEEASLGKLQEKRDVSLTIAGSSSVKQDDGVLKRHGTTELDGVCDHKNGMYYHILVSAGVTRETPMHIAPITVEMASIAKAGGRGDVVTSLSPTIQDLKCNVDRLLPNYDCLNLSNMNDFYFHKSHGVALKLKSGLGRQKDFLSTFVSLKTKSFRMDTVATTIGKDWVFFCYAALEFLLQGHNLESGTQLIGKATVYDDKATMEFPIYSREIARNSVIASQLYKFHGILIGIDPDRWDPISKLPSFHLEDKVNL